MDRLVDGTWERMRLPDELSTDAGAYDVYGTSADDVYLAVTAGKSKDFWTPQVAHWDGTEWSVQEIPTPADWGTGGTAEHIGITDVDVHEETGELPVSELPEPFESEIATYDGEQWTTYPQLANSQSQPNRAKHYITSNVE